MATAIANPPLSPSLTQLNSQEENMMEQITKKNRKMRRKLISETTPSTPSSTSSSPSSIRKRSTRKVPVRVYVRDSTETNDLRKQLTEMEKLQAMYKDRISELESQVCGFKYEKSPPTVPLHKMTIQPDLALPAVGRSSPNTRRQASSSSNESVNSGDSGVSIPVQPALSVLPHAENNHVYARVSSKPHPDRTKLLALYDYTPAPELKGRLSFHEGDVMLLVSMRSRSGWWQAELNGIVGKIPSNYVEQLDPTKVFKARVIRNFDSSQPGDMSIQRGSLVTILKRQDNGWYLGEKNSTTGFFPSSCVERVATMRP